MGFISITLKVANMRNEQSFTIYPYDGDDYVLLQSSKRMMRINLRTGEGVINSRNEQNGAYFYHVTMAPLRFKVDDVVLLALKEYFWNNEGKDGGGSVISWANKKLYSNE